MKNNMEIPKQYKSLEYLHDIEWRDIFAVWRAYEAYQKSWEKHWQERGFKSYDEWRGHYIAPIKPKEKQWKIYRINNPLEDIKLFYGVPSRGWIAKCYNGETTKQLLEILSHPVISKNDKIEAIINNFSYQTMLTGIVNESKIVLVEGMHRACALALMGKNKKTIAGDVVIALARHDREIPHIGKGDIKK